MRRRTPLYRPPEPRLTTRDSDGCGCRLPTACLWIAETFRRASRSHAWRRPVAALTAGQRPPGPYAMSRRGPEDSSIEPLRCGGTRCSGSGIRVQSMAAEGDLVGAWFTVHVAIRATTSWHGGKHQADASRSRHPVREEGAPISFASLVRSAVVEQTRPGEAPSSGVRPQRGRHLTAARVRQVSGRGR